MVNLLRVLSLTICFSCSAIAADKPSYFYKGESEHLALATKASIGLAALNLALAPIVASTCMAEHHWFLAGATILSPYALLVKYAGFKLFKDELIPHGRGGLKRLRRIFRSKMGTECEPINPSLGPVEEGAYGATFSSV